MWNETERRSFNLYLHTKIFEDLAYWYLLFNFQVERFLFKLATLDDRGLFLARLHGPSLMMSAQIANTSVLGFIAAYPRLVN